MILGITGGTGTGKSSACKFFKDRGFFIIDSDIVARQVCDKGTECLKEIEEYFGLSVIAPDGSLKRKELGRIVFADEKKLAKLNDITHKYIVKEIKDIIEKNADKNVVIDAPLLLETGLDSICTKTLCVLADKNIRKERIMKRDNLTETEALSRIESQMDDEFYISKCDYAVSSNQGFDSLKKGLSEIFGGNYGI